jgi:uncharacterized protein YkwD
MMFDAWKASPGHNANMLRASFREVGFHNCLGTDYEDNETLFMVTTFGYSNQHDV